MTSETWSLICAGALAFNAASGFGYRVYRMTKGGPMGDVIGQAILGALLALVAIGVALGQGWARWGAVVYGLLFGVAVMPVWVLGVLIPSEPRVPDYGFTIAYWLALVVVVVSAIAA